MHLTSAGGCILLKNNSSNKDYIVTVDIDGSVNLRIDEGDTMVKKDVRITAGSTNSAILKTLTSGEGPSLQLNLQPRSVPGAEAANIKDQWTDFVNQAWPRFDVNGNGVLDRDEAMKFIR